MKSIVILAAFVVFSTMGYAQTKHQKGPAAKNHQRYYTQATTVATTDQKPFQGPAAKNTMIRKSDQSYTINPVETNANQPRLMGPQAKNAESWKKHRAAGARVKAPAN
ncbi:MAG: hypothetical protein DHS20C17_04730 [Cyclobacteriaceae bacterium]|nr:MAG: hypothetical protein DHS20C17_04730 [Cyclobacteriaceae bacterium]